MVDLIRLKREVKWLNRLQARRSMTSYTAKPLSCNSLDYSPLIHLLGSLIRVNQDF